MTPALRAATAAITLAALAAPSTHATGPADMPDEVYYHFMPISWRDGNNDQYRFGDFQGMTDSLDYLEDLGITAVWMNPIFPSPAYHGYQHGRADQVNTRHGTEAEFLAFVNAAHARGIKVYVDIVVYGISHDSPWFQSAYSNPASPYDSWLAFQNGSNTSYLGSTYNSWNGANVGFIHWNLNTAAAASLVTGWSTRWLDPNNDGNPADGIDGYRLDHVWEQYGSGPNGWGYNIDDFWIPWKQALRAVNPDCVTFAEQADWGSHGAELLPAHDAAFTKPLEFAARDAINARSATGLYNQVALTLASLPSNLPDRTYLATLGNHDVDRLTPTLGGSMSRAKVAAAVLMTLPFPPVIYAGDEIGMLGTKQNYGSDANDIPMREPFKWNAVAGPPMTNYQILNGPASSNMFSQNNDGRSVEEQQGIPGSLLETYRDLIDARRQSPALRRGDYIPVEASRTSTWTFLRHHAQQTVLVVVNLDDVSRSMTLNLTDTLLPPGGTIPINLIDGTTLPAITEANQAAYPLTLPGSGFRILEVSLQPIARQIDGRDIADGFSGPGASRALQDTPTTLGDNVTELDQLFAEVMADDLRLGITGNLATDGTGIAILVDAAPGGQNILNTSGVPVPPAGPDQLDGLRLDAGFAPDILYFVNAYSGVVFVDSYLLPTSGPAIKTYRGQVPVNSGSGVLTGGSNTTGLEIAIDNTNLAGITASSVVNAASAATGLEARLPFADLGLSGAPASPPRIACFALLTNGTVTSQHLPGLAGQTTHPGTAPDFTTIPGDQYVTVTPVEPDDCPDIDGSGTVDFEDLNLLLAAWSTTVPPGTGPDVTGDGLVDFDDLNAILAAWGEAC
ncbi:MAG: alpha-glucosidase C-terminal domain-containing protein [Phycisphaerales bacterium]|nr:alpha-glucosidase C-terminal domain-containing protein [Phycisphaerales bacterium]